MKIAGRCLCGMVDEWVARNPDEHMRCYGIKWCRLCGDVIPNWAICRCDQPSEDEAREDRKRRLDRARQRRRYARMVAA